MLSPRRMHAEPADDPDSDDSEEDGAPPARPRVRFVTEVGQVVEFEGKPSFSTRGHWHKAADSPGAPPLDVHCVTQPSCAMCYETNMDDCNWKRRFGGVGNHQISFQNISDAHAYAYAHRSCF